MNLHAGAVHHLWPHEEDWKECSDENRRDEKSRHHHDDEVHGGGELLHDLLDILFIHLVEKVELFPGSNRVRRRDLEEIALRRTERHGTRA